MGKLWESETGDFEPSGSDDATRLQTYINDTLSDGRQPTLSDGTFIVASGITIRSAKTLATGFNQKAGASLFGQGPGSTIIKSAGLGATPLFSINYPVSIDGTRRNYLVEMGNFSILSCDSAGTEVASASPTGTAIAIKPLAAAAEVAFLVKLRRMFINGFATGLILSDVTSTDIEDVWFHIFSVGIKLGFNVDILNIRDCAFGSEYYDQYDSATAIQTGYSDGFNTAGSENNGLIQNTWFMAINKAYEIQDQNQGPLTFRNCYYERVKRYLHALTGTSSYGVRVKFDSCLFSLMSTNNVNQPDPTAANYGAKIHFDGTISSSSSGPSMQLTIENCRGEVTAQDNALVSFNYRGNESIIHWNNNIVGASSTYGHLRCVRTAYSTWLTIPNNGNGTHVFADTIGGGLTQISGQERVVTATISSGATYNLNHYAGDFFILTLPDGNCTLNSAAYAGSNLQNNLVSRRTKMRVLFIVPASVTAARTLTFASGIKGAGASIAYNTAEQNLELHLNLVGYADSGNALLHVGPTPAFV